MYIIDPRNKVFSLKIFCLKQPGAAILKRMDRAHMALCCALRLVEALFKLEMCVYVVKHCVSAVCGHNAHIVYALVGVSAEMG